MLRFSSLRFLFIPTFIAGMTVSCSGSKFRGKAQPVTVHNMADMVAVVKDDRASAEATDDYDQSLQELMDQALVDVRHLPSDMVVEFDGTSIESFASKYENIYGFIMEHDLDLSMTSNDLFDYYRVDPADSDLSDEELFNTALHAFATMDEEGSDYLRQAFGSMALADSASGEGISKTCKGLVEAYNDNSKAGLVAGLVSQACTAG